MSLITVDSEWGMFKDADLGDATLQQNNLDGKDYARHTPTTAKTLASTPAAGVTLPTSAVHAIISVATNPIRIRTGGTNPTASEGLLLPVGTILSVTNQRSFLEQLRFIDTAAGASEVTVMYGRMA